MSVREAQTFGSDSLLARYASLVKLPHTLFALPFGGVGVVLASYGRPAAIDVVTLLWILVAFTTARFAAMGFNRIVDHRLDALNPRTRRRELPTGRLSVPQAAFASAFASAVFVGAAWQLNPLCGWLAPLALAWIFGYSYTKRFTAWSHLVLGLSLGIAPAGAYLAVSGAWTEPWHALVVLALAVMFWVAGFDVIYSLQDIEFDRAQRLHSLPARLGAARGLRHARGFHGAAVLLFLAVWLFGLFPVGWLYVAAVASMAALLVEEHRTLRAQPAGALEPRRMDRAFFKLNVGISSAFFVFTLLDRLV